MAVIADHTIRALLNRDLVQPVDERLVNPASLDLRLGDTLLIESAASPELVPYPLYRHTLAEPYLLQPHQFALADTLERVKIPPTLSGQIALKSSVARLGLEHLMAGWIDPGYEGTITLELHNSRQLHPIPLWPGMRLCQLVLLRMDSVPQHDYSTTGRYMNRLEPTPSLGIPE